MHKLHSRALLLAAVLAATMALAACGGGDDRTVGDAANPGGPAAQASSDVPRSAQDSVSGLLAYVGQLIDSMTNSTAEPVLIGNATLPTSETAEPAP